MEGLNLFSKKSGKVIPARVPLDRDLPEYPKDYFDKHRKKPPLEIQTHSVTLADLRQMVAGQISSGELDLKVCKAYLLSLMETLKEKLLDDWISFEVKIGAKDEEITPLHIVEVTKVAGAGSLDSPFKDSSATDSDDQWMCMYLLGIYRIGRVTNKQYQTQLIENLNKMTHVLRPDAPQMTQAMQAFDTWPNDSTYCKIVACFDMFYCKFKKSAWAAVRFGTISSRYKDSAALTSMTHFGKLLGANLADCLEWSFVARVSEEIEGMLRPDQELDKPDSYMPYMMDLGISKTSPYSSVRNPGWHLFCHTVGSLMQSARSYNARHLEAADQSNIISNAELVVYVYETRIMWSKGFRKDGEVDKSDDLADYNAEVIGSNSLPSTTKADDWFTWMKLNNFELPSECLAHCAKNARKLKNSRDGSIGKYIYARLAD
ncbi:MAG: nucleocapsid protein [Wufeng bat tupavirus 2]|nr:MAG: nucleocapsid protein [Wufeng bat tupavirus 2]